MSHLIVRGKLCLRERGVYICFEHKEEHKSYLSSQWCLDVYAHARTPCVLGPKGVVAVLRLVSVSLSVSIFLSIGTPLSGCSPSVVPPSLSTVLSA